MAPGGLSNLNLYSNRAAYKKTAFLAKDSPGHERFPDENGMTPSKRNWPCSSKNRSGRKQNGSSQRSGSWWMAQRLTKMVMPRGIKKPARDVSRVVEWGTANGVSLTTRWISAMNASKYGKLGLSDICGSRFVLPMTSSSWRWSLACTFGYLMA